MSRYLIVLITLFLPISSQASVIINEVAWMGDLTSANHEWIELYNSGTESANVDGWTLGDGANLLISLTGTIPASSYVVLERTSEESSPATAFLIYTGALVNTGATLTLKNADSLIMDQVVGGEGWMEIGGDNTSKDTAQYTTKGWVTDVSTPGRQNKSGRVETDIKQNPISDNNARQGHGNVAMPNDKVKSTSLVTPNTVLKLEIETQDVAYVNQTIPFSVSGEGVGKTIISSLVYTWNFGDTYSGQGRKVEHSFSYPGTYVVMVNAKYGRHDETVRKEITVLPVNFSITENDNGDIQIHNDSPYDVDISSFVIRGDKEVVLPPKSIILPKATITIAKNRLGGKSNLVVMYDNKGNSVTSNFSKLYTDWNQEKSYAVDEAESVVRLMQNEKSTFNTTLAKAQEIFLPSVSRAETLVEEVFASTTDKIEEETPSALSLDRKTEDKNGINWSYLGLILLIIIVLILLRFSRR